MRYRTVGDWYWDNKGDLYIDVADTTCWRSNLCIAIHELVEAKMCVLDKVSQDQVDKWDKEHYRSKEPGDMLFCPYRKQHKWATVVEVLVATLLLLDWPQHEKNCEFAWKRTKR